MSVIEIGFCSLDGSTFLHWFIYERDYPGFTSGVIHNLFQSLAASLIAGYATYLALTVFGPMFGLTTLVGVFLQGLCAGAIGIVVWILMLILLKNQEVREVWATLHHKIWGAKVVVPDAEHL